MMECQHPAACAAAGGRHPPASASLRSSSASRRSHSASPCLFSSCTSLWHMPDSTAGHQDTSQRADGQCCRLWCSPPASLACPPLLRWHVPPRFTGMSQGCFAVAISGSLLTRQPPSCRAPPYTAAVQGRHLLFVLLEHSGHGAALAQAAARPPRRPRPLQRRRCARAAGHRRGGARAGHTQRGPRHQLRPAHAGARLCAQVGAVVVAVRVRVRVRV